MVILKRSLQNFYKILNKCFLCTTWTVMLSNSNIQSHTGVLSDAKGLNLYRCTYSYRCNYIQLVIRVFTSNRFISVSGSMGTSLPSRKSVVSSNAARSYSRSLWSSSYAWNSSRKVPQVIYSNIINYWTIYELFQPPRFRSKIYV